MAGELMPQAAVIFGASGDLTERKIIPALYYLSRERLLPEEFSVIGCGRTAFTHEQCRDFRQLHSDSLFPIRFSQSLNLPLHRRCLRRRHPNRFPIPKFQTPNLIHSERHHLNSLHCRNNRKHNRAVQDLSPASITRPACRADFETSSWSNQ